MPDEMQVREAVVTSRVPQSLANRLAGDAVAEDRSVSNLVRRILTEHYERKDAALEKAA